MDDEHFERRFIRIGFAQGVRPGHILVQLVTDGVPGFRIVNLYRNLPDELFGGIDGSPAVEGTEGDTDFFQLFNGRLGAPVTIVPYGSGVQGNDAFRIEGPVITDGRDLFCRRRPGAGYVHADQGGVAAYGEDDLGELLAHADNTQALFIIPFISELVATGSQKEQQTKEQIISII